MTSINKLTQNKSANADDLIPIWDSENKRTRSLSVNVLSEFIILDDQKFIESGSYSDGVLTLQYNTGETITISGFQDEDKYVNAGVYEDETLTLTLTDGTNITVTGFKDGSDLDQYLKYNPETDQLETSKSIQTALNSFFLGEQVKVSSSGSGLATKNMSTKEVSYSASTTIGDHSQAAVRDGTPDRVKAPKFGAILEVEPRGEPAISGAVDFTLETTLAQSLSIFEIDVIVEQAVEVGDVLLYDIRDRDAASVSGGFIAVYEQVLKPDQPLQPGEILQWTFTENSNILESTNLLVQMLIDKGGLGVDVKPLKVRPALREPTEIYAKLKAREYELKALAYLDEISGGGSDDITIEVDGSVLAANVDTLDFDSKTINVIDVGDHRVTIEAKPQNASNFLGIFESTADLLNQYPTPDDGFYAHVMQGDGKYPDDRHESKGGQWINMGGITGETVIDDVKYKSMIIGGGLKVDDSSGSATISTNGKQKVVELDVDADNTVTLDSSYAGEFISIVQSVTTQPKVMTLTLSDFDYFDEGDTLEIARGQEYTNYYFIVYYNDKDGGIRAVYPNNNVKFVRGVKFWDVQKDGKYSDVAIQPSSVFQTPYNPESGYARPVDAFVFSDNQAISFEESGDGRVVKIDLSTISFETLDTDKININPKSAGYSFTSNKIDGTPLFRIFNGENQDHVEYRKTPAEFEESINLFDVPNILYSDLRYVKRDGGWIAGDLVVMPHSAYVMGSDFYVAAEGFFITTGTELFTGDRVYNPETQGWEGDFYKFGELKTDYIEFEKLVVSGDTTVNNGEFKVKGSDDSSLFSVRPDNNTATSNAPLTVNESISINKNSGVVFNINNNRIKFWSSGAIELPTYTDFKDKELITKEYVDGVVASSVEYSGEGEGIPYRQLVDVSNVTQTSIVGQYSNNTTSTVDFYINIDESISGALTYINGGNSGTGRKFYVRDNKTNRTSNRTIRPYESWVCHSFLTGDFNTTNFEWFRLDNGTSTTYLTIDEINERHLQELTRQTRFGAGTLEIDSLNFVVDGFTANNLNIDIDGFTANNLNMDIDGFTANNLNIEE